MSRGRVRDTSGPMASASLEDRVRKWLSDQGYPLEMRVARITGAAGAGWDHGRVYLDPLTGKTREIDLMGYFDRATWSDPPFSVHVIFECKHTRDKPWILFCTDRPGIRPSGFVRTVPATTHANKAIIATLKEAHRTKDASPIASMDMFRPPGELVGFNLARAHTDNQDTAFHAMRGVSGAAEATANNISKHGHAVMYLPVIVIDSPLMQCFLPDGQDDVELTEIGRGVLLYPTGPGSRTLIHVVTVEALPEFLGRVASDSEKLRSLVDPNLQ